jgi:hypothetical protein
MNKVGWTKVLKQDHVLDHEYKVEYKELKIDPFPLNLQEYNIILFKLLKKELRTWLVTNNFRIKKVKSVFEEDFYLISIFGGFGYIYIYFKQHDDMSIKCTIEIHEKDYVLRKQQMYRREGRRILNELSNIVSVTLNQLVKDAHMAAYLPIRDKTGRQLDPAENKIAEFLGLQHKLPKPNFTKPNFMRGGSRLRSRSRSRSRLQSKSRSRSRSRSRLSGGGYVQVKDLIVGQTYTFAFRDPRQRTNPPFEGIVLRKMTHQNRNAGIRGVPDETHFAFIKELKEDQPYTNLYFGPSWITDAQFLIKDQTRISERRAAEALGRVFTAIPSSAIGNVAEFLGHSDATGELVRAEVADKGRPGDIPSVLRPRN